MWLTCFLTVKMVTNSSFAMARFGEPAASIASTCSSRPVSGSTRPGTPVAASGPEPGTPGLPSNASVTRARCLNGLPRPGACPGPAGGDDAGEQGAHRRPLVGEDPHVAFRGGQGERLGHACVRDAGDGQGRLAGLCGDLQRQLVGAERCVQAAPGEVNTAQQVADRDRRAALAARHPAMLAVKPRSASSSRPRKVLPDKYTIG